MSSPRSSAGVATTPADNPCRPEKWRAEFNELKRLLLRRRLVTVVGPAGTGKSWLAAEVARRTAGRFGGRVRVVDVGTDLASASGEGLLVLDGCERRLPEVARMVYDLLTRCRDLTVLATSREPLELPGEVNFPIGRLSGVLADVPLESLRYAVVDSYDRLTTVERRAFCALTVFESGFDVDAAAAVCDVDDVEVLTLLARLENRSMIVADGRGRFRLPEPYRACALEWLGADQAVVRSRLVAWALSVAAPVVDEPAETEATMRRWCDDEDNLRQALRHARAEQRVPIAVALARSCRDQGRTTEAEAVLTAVLGVSHAVVLVEAGWQACGRGDHEGALRLGEAALEEAGSLALIGQALRLLGFVQLARGEHGAARELIERWVGVARELNRPLAAAWGRHGLAWVDLRTGDLDRAAETLAEVTAVAQALGANRLRAASMITTAGVALARGEPGTARLLFVELLRTNPEDGWTRRYGLEGLVLTEAASGRAERALLLAGAATANLAGAPVATEPRWRDQVTRAITAARNEIGRRADELLASGARLTVAEAVGRVLLGDQLAELTARELEAARLVATGATNGQIARALHVSSRTVTAVLNRVRSKLGLRRRIDIAVWITERQI